MAWAGLARAPPPTWPLLVPGLSWWRRLWPAWLRGALAGAPAAVVADLPPGVLEGAAGLALQSPPPPARREARWPAAGPVGWRTRIFVLAAAAAAVMGVPLPLGSGDPRLWGSGGGGRFGPASLLAPVARLRLAGPASVGRFIGSAAAAGDDAGGG